MRKTRKEKIIRAAVYCSITAILVALFIISFVGSFHALDGLSAEMQILEGEVNFAKAVAMLIIIAVSGALSAKAVRLARR